MTSLMDEQPRRKGTSLDPRNRGTRILSPGFSGDEAETLDNGPVTGWLVVIEGPGRGRGVELGFGMNTIGASPDNRVQLDFGDPGISRDEHFAIAYDLVGRTFHVLRGRGKNLVYVGGEMLADARELRDGADIKLGQTQLRFVALCTADWAWPDTGADAPTP